jgi:N-acetylmuramoyl-L-alanine amidase
VHARIRQVDVGVHKLVAAFVVVVLAGCSGGGAEPAAVTSTTSTTTTTTTTMVPTTTTTTAVPPLAAFAVPPGGETRAVITSTGVVAPVLGVDPGGFVVRTPCGGTAVANGLPLPGATIVLDPGHGGDELGAVGANGLAEKDVNLLVATRAADLLRAAGATVVVTRTTDVRMTLEVRAEIVNRLAPRAFVSVHHNGGSDGPSARPGTETWAQHADPQARRLGGLLYEELLPAFAAHEGVAWQSDLDAGAKYRLNRRGGDYYGILRRTNGVPAVLTEALFLSNPPEAELLARPDVQEAEAAAIARALTRFLTTDDPGSGFVEPYARADPAGPGGGGSGCVDPPLA